MLYIIGFVSTSSTENGKLFILYIDQKKKYWNKLRGVIIDQIAMCYDYVLTSSTK